MAAALRLRFPPLPRAAILAQNPTTYWQSLPRVEDVFSLIARSRALTTLHLSGSSDWAKIWTLLRTSPELGIRLKHFSTNVITREASVHAGEALWQKTRELGGRTWRVWMGPRRRFAEIMFAGPERMRDTRGGTLLSCPVGFPSRWTFGAHNATVFARLDALVSFELSATTREATDLLLRNAVRLPTLHTLVISPAASSDNGGTRNVYAARSAAAHAGIRTAVKDFRSPVFSPATVLAVHRFYMLWAVLDESGRERAPVVESGGLPAYQRWLAFQEVQVDPKSSAFAALRAYRMNRA
ncbi:hypothetical protein C8R43DRAFT_1241184 [Mycena crocata]|nr:hypothetical protein C8R43DRAFT_1241184 [Mycena crocata]